MRLKLLVLSAFILMVSSCTDPDKVGVTAKPEFDRTGQVISLKVEVYQTETELRKVLKARNIKVAERKEDRVRNVLSGQSIWYTVGNDCEIFIVRPVEWKVDGESTLTLGHELDHCLYGNYHN